MDFAAGIIGQPNGSSTPQKIKYMWRKDLREPQFRFAGVPVLHENKLLSECVFKVAVVGVRSNKGQMLACHEIYGA